MRIGWKVEECGDAWGLRGCVGGVAQRRGRTWSDVAGRRKRGGGYEYRALIQETFANASDIQNAQQVFVGKDRMEVIHDQREILMLCKTANDRGAFH